MIWGCEQPALDSWSPVDELINDGPSSNLKTASEIGIKAIRESYMQVPRFVVSRG